MGDTVYGEEAEKENKRLHNQAFSVYLRHGIEALNTEQRELMKRRFVGKPIGSIKAAQPSPPPAAATEFHRASPTCWRKLKW